MPADIEVQDLDTIINGPTDTAPDTDTSTDTDIEASDVDDVDVDSSEDTDVDSDEAESAESTDVDPKASKKGIKEEHDLAKIKDKDLPEKYQKLFKEDKTLRRMYHENRQYASTFGSPQEASKIAETLESFGGIESMETELKEMATENTMFMSGDPAVIDTWAEMSPEGFSKLVPTALEKYTQTDPEGWNHLSARIIQSSILHNKVWDYINDAYAELPEGSKGAKALESLAANYLNKIQDIAKQQPTKKVDPERTKLEADRAAFEQQKREAFSAEVSKEVGTIWSDSVDSNLKPYISGKKLSKDQINGIKDLASIQYRKMLAKNDPNAEQQMISILNEGDKAKFLKYTQGKLDKYMEKAVQQAWRMFNGTTKTVAPANAAKKTAKLDLDTPVYVNAVPRAVQIDRDATAKLAQKQGVSYEKLTRDKKIAVLKNGQVVDYSRVFAE